MAGFEDLQAMLAGMRAQPAPAPQPTTIATPFNNIQSLFTGGDITPMLRSIGGGMANMTETNDPFVAFGRGFGGAQNQQATAAQTAAEQAAAAKQKEFENAMALNNALINQNTTQQKMTMDQSQFDARTGQDQKQFDEQMQLRKAQDERQAKMDEINYKKTEAELIRMADSNGLTVNQMLEIERLAQAEGENIISPEKRKVAVDAKRQELLERFGGKKISGKSELSDPDIAGQSPEYVRNKDTGQIMKLDPSTNQYVPVQQ